ncbi:MAG: squalene/phytoene synthase family protein [Rhodanobacteraceae bacterium]
MSDSALDSYVSSWREADPQRAVAELFLRRGERTRYGACAALLQEWRRTLHDVREPQVAVAKLGWWHEELQRAAEGGARHPLAQVLFAGARVREVPLSCWTAVLDAAIGQLAAPPPADFLAQQRAAEPWSAAVAELEARLWFGPSAGVVRANAVTSIAYLVADVRCTATEAAHGRSPLPMNLMARHELTVEGLAGDSPARRAALRDYAVLLRDALTEAAAIPGPLTLFRAVDMQRDLRSLERAVRAEDPLSALCAQRTGVGNLLKIWRVARMWRGTAKTEAAS